jgi:hypothetical protein
MNKILVAGVVVVVAIIVGVALVVFVGGKESSLGPGAYLVYNATGMGIEVTYRVEILDENSTHYKVKIKTEGSVLGMGKQSVENTTWVEKGELLVDEEYMKQKDCSYEGTEKVDLGFTKITAKKYVCPTAMGNTLYFVDRQGIPVMVTDDRHSMTFVLVDTNVKLRDA